MAPVPTRQPLRKETGMPVAHYTDSSIDTTQDNVFVSCEEEAFVTWLTLS